MKVGRGTHLYKLGYRYCITFPNGRRNRLQWAEATSKLTDLFGEPTHRRYFYTFAGRPYVAKQKEWILDRKWFSDTRHWDRAATWDIGLHFVTNDNSL